MSHHRGHFSARSAQGQKIKQTIIVPYCAPSLQPSLILEPCYLSLKCVCSQSSHPSRRTCSDHTEIDTFKHHQEQHMLQPSFSKVSCSRTITADSHATITSESNQPSRAAKRPCLTVLRTTWNVNVECKYGHTFNRIILTTRRKLIWHPLTNGDERKEFPRGEMLVSYQ